MRIEFMVVGNIKIAVCWNVMACSLVDRYCIMEVCTSQTTLLHMPEDYNISREAQEEDCISLSINWRLFVVL